MNTLRPAVARLGASVIARGRAICLTAGIWWGTLLLAFRRESWPRTVREQVGRQILFSGVDALGLTAFVAVATGVSVVAQGQLWLARFGQSELLGRLLVAVIIRELGPLLVNFLVIARSGTAIVTELATMRVQGEVKLLELQGIDPMQYLVLPRMIGLAVSVVCLAMFFIAMSLVTGFAVSLTVEAVGTRDAFAFMESVLRPVRVSDILNLLAKTILPGMATGMICCVEGLMIRGVATEVPQAATRAVVRSMTALLFLSALISVLTYM